MRIPRGEYDFTSGRAETLVKRSRSSSHVSVQYGTQRLKLSILLSLGGGGPGGAAASGAAPGAGITGIARGAGLFLRASRCFILTMSSLQRTFGFLLALSLAMTSRISDRKALSSSLVIILLRRLAPAVAPSRASLSFTSAWRPRREGRLPPGSPYLSARLGGEGLPDRLGKLYEHHAHLPLDLVGD